MNEKILSESRAAELVAAAKHRLKNGGFKVALQMRGLKRNLSIRAIFPPKHGSPHTKPYQARQSLKLSANTLQNIREAEAIAKQVGLDLEAGTFDWRKWSDWEEPTPADVKTIGDWVAELKTQYFALKGTDAPVISTWRSNYQTPFRTLPPDEPLSEKLLYDWILQNTEPGTSSRSHYCTAARALAELAQINLNLKGFKQFVVQAVNPRLIPSDAELLAIREAIEDPGWQYLFGLQLCYGLRTHEVLTVDLSGFPRIRVTRGKTGPRTVTPVLPEWAKEWRLHDRILPRQLKLDPEEPFNYLGARICRGYRRLELPTPYTLRHAFARRTLEVGLDPSLSAKLMGHSLTMHVQTYRAWISESVYLDAVERMLESRH